MNIRCSTCCRKLAEAQGFELLSIKCPRCGSINTLNAASIKQERPSASFLEQLGHDRKHR